MPSVQVLAGRSVPLGGVRALDVRRTLPHRERSRIGAWCFVDHYGPESIRDTSRDGMDVPPHPHCGLQTLSWLFAGTIEHRDSGGVIGLVRRGEMNLMTSGHGIAHSEVSTPDTTTLHGVQLWIALPDHARQAARRFEHHAPQEVPLANGAGTALVFLGDLIDVDTSPVRTFTPLVGAELRLEPGAELTLTIDPSFEHAVLVDAGEVTLNDQALRPSDLGCVGVGATTLTIAAGPEPARLILIGGEPLDEDIVMWWNFIARTHEEIVEAREAYEAGSDRFGTVDGYVGTVERIPAPPIPPVRLRPRGR